MCCAWRPGVVRNYMQVVIARVNPCWCGGYLSGHENVHRLQLQCLLYGVPLTSLGRNKVFDK